MVLYFIAFVLLLLYFLSFMEDKRQYKLLLAQGVPSGNASTSVITAPSSNPKPMKILDIIISLLKDPQSTMRRLKDETVTSAGTYFLILAGIMFIPFGLLAGLGLSLRGFAPAMIVIYLIEVIGWLFFVFLVNAVLCIIDRPYGLSQTLSTAFYAVTPLAVLGWIPLIGSFSVFWALFLMKCGLQERQDIPEKKAFIAVVVPAVIFIFVFFLVLLNIIFVHQLFSQIFNF
ncbi:MAG: YIP1 family protein [Methanoregula sp.]